VTTVTDPIDIDPCPYCGISDGIQQTSDQRLHGGAAHFWKTSRNRSRAA
jgi:hypothetical protein